MNFSRTWRACAWGAAAGIPLWGMAGCHSSDTGETTEAGREAAQASAKQARSQAAGVSGAVMKNGSFSGTDAQGRPLWSVEAREIHVFRDAGTKSTDIEALAPRRAFLLQAQAKLFQAGKLEAQLFAPRLNYVQNDSGDHMTLTNAAGAPKGTYNVIARSSGTVRPDVGPMVIRAPRMDVTPRTRQLVAPQGAKAFNALRKATVTADHADSNTDLGILHARGHVHAVGPQGSMNSDFAVWNWQAGRAGATGHVTATNGQAVLTGERLNANTDVSRGEVTGGVTARSGDGGTATAPRMTFDWAGRMLQGSGGVVMQKDGGTLRAPRVASDADLKAATATGGVTIEKEGATLRAARVDAYDKLSRAIATGGVTMTREGATLTANRVEAFDNFNSAHATGAVHVTRGDMTITATSATATNLKDQKRLLVQGSGGVQAQSKDGNVRASRAVWSGGQDGQIQASGGVTLVRQGSTLTAPRGTARLNGGAIASAVMEGGVHGKMPNGATIVAPRATYTAAKGGQVVATGGVTARQEGRTLTSATLNATQGGDVLTLLGNVVVTTPDGVTVRTPDAVYDKRTDTLIASHGVIFDDARHGMHQTARNMIVHNFSNEKTRHATLEGVQGSTKMNPLKKLKVF